MTTNTQSLNYDSIMIKTSSGVTMAKLNIFSQPVVIKRLLLVHIQTDSLGQRANFGAHIEDIKRQLNNKSYNQSFINWDISTTEITHNDINQNRSLLLLDSLLCLQAQNLTNLGKLFNSAVAMINLSGIQYDKDTYIAFIINNSIQSTSFVYEGIGFGFGTKFCMISNDGYDPKTMANELGHLLKLHHPFSKITGPEHDNKVTDEDFQRESTSKNSTENVMDYDKSRMNTFWLWQWIILNNNIKYYKK